MTVRKTKYKTSEISKNNILEACKELFYLNGYTKTTYVDICKKADSNPGLINYYYKAKRNIAGEILGEFMKDIKEKTKEYLLNTYGEYELQIGTTLEIRIFSHLLEQDENLARFYHDISLEGLEYDSDVILKFYQLHVEEYNLPFDEEEVKLIATSVIGSGIGVTKRMLEGYFKCEPKKIFNFRIRTMYNLMGISNERVNEILDKTEEIYNNMKDKIRLNNYFKFEIVS